MGGHQSKSDVDEPTSPFSELIGEFVGENCHSVNDDIFWNQFVSVISSDSFTFGERAARSLARNGIVTQNLGSLIWRVASSVSALPAPTATGALRGLVTVVNASVAVCNGENVMNLLASGEEVEGRKEKSAIVVQSLVHFFAGRSLSAGVPRGQDEQAMVQSLFVILSLLSTRLYRSPYELYGGNAEIDDIDLFLSSLAFAPLPTACSFVRAVLNCVSVLTPRVPAPGASFWEVTKAAFFLPGTHVWQLPYTFYHLYRGSPVMPEDVSLAILVLLVGTHYQANASLSFSSTLNEALYSLNARQGTISPDGVEDEEAPHSPVGAGTADPLFDRPLDGMRAVDFEKLFQGLCSWMNDERGVLLFYTLLVRSPAFFSFICEREDVGAAIVPLLRLLYTSCTSMTQVHRVSLILIVLVVLSSSPLFVSRTQMTVIDSFAVGFGVPPIYQVSCSSLCVIVAARCALRSIAKGETGYVLSNSLAVLCNFLPRMRGMHASAAMRIVDLSIALSQRLLAGNDALLDVTRTSLEAVACVCSRLQPPAALATNVEEPQTGKGAVSRDAASGNSALVYSLLYCSHRMPLEDLVKIACLEKPVRVIQKVLRFFGPRVKNILSPQPRQSPAEAAAARALNPRVTADVLGWKAIGEKEGGVALGGSSQETVSDWTVEAVSAAIASVFKEWIQKELEDVSKHEEVEGDVAAEPDDETQWWEAEDIVPFAYEEREGSAGFFEPFAWWILYVYAGRQLKWSGDRVELFTVTESGEMSHQTPSDSERGGGTAEVEDDGDENV